MSMAALVPGLAVQVEGTYNAQNQLVATSVKFKGNDLEQAQTVQAGLQPAMEQIQQSQQELDQQKAELAQQQQALAQQQQEMAITQEKVAANKAAIAAANKRFGQLGDYNILDEVTVYFANGKVTIDPKYKPQLQQLAEKAKTITAYMIQVKGYASSVRQRCAESETERRSRQQRDSILATAGSHSAHQYACSGCDGREQAGRQRQDS